MTAFAYDDDDNLVGKTVYYVNYEVLKGDAGNHSYGFFGTISNATIKNLTLKDVNIDRGNKGDSVGAIVGFSGGNLTIENCQVSGSVKGNNAVSGIVGRAYSEIQGDNTVIKIENNINNAVITSNKKAAGIVGFYSSVKDVSIRNNTNNGKVTALTEKAAGICITGATKDSVNISYNTNNADITGYDNAVTAIAFSGNDKPIVMVPSHITINNVNYGKLYTHTGDISNAQETEHIYLVYGGKSQSPADNETDDSSYTGGVVVLEINEIVQD